MRWWSISANKDSHCVLAAVSHSLQYSLSRATVLKSDGITDFLSEHDVHFICHSLSHAHGSHSPGLSASHRSLGARQTSHHVHTPLWDLKKKQRLQGVQCALHYECPAHGTRLNLKHFTPVLSSQSQSLRQGRSSADVWWCRWSCPCTPILEAVTSSSGSRSNAACAEGWWTDWSADAQPFASGAAKLARPSRCWMAH